MLERHPRILATLAILSVSVLSLAALSDTRAAHVAAGDSNSTALDVLQPLQAIVDAVSNEPDLAYGMNGIYAADVMERSGVELQYGQVWVGKWYGREEGRERFEQNVATVRGNGLVPVVEWWYFGDQISVNAVTNGLPDGRSVAKWHEMGPRVARSACAASGGELVLVVETEFNKGGVARLESFDGELAKHIRLLKAACPSATVVLGFGLWGLDDWHRFDRAAGAADAVGFQLMRSLAKDTRAEYEAAPEDAVKAARKLQELFGKPIYLHDIALSSYGTGGRALQARILEEVLEQRDELKDAGVVLVLYRSVRDTPSMAKNNYYGQGEAHWGLWTRAGQEKPAFDVWVKALSA